MNAHESRYVAWLTGRIEELERAAVDRVNSERAERRRLREMVADMERRLSKANREVRRLRGDSPVKAWRRMTAEQKASAIRARMSERWQA